MTSKTAHLSIICVSAIGALAYVIAIIAIFFV